MYLKQTMTLILGGLLFLNNALYADELAVKRFQAALSACDRALQMEMPKSRGSLKILQSLQKRYQRNKQLALETEESLKDSKEQLYTGEFFVEETFEKVFQTCESKLAAKVAEAEEIVAAKVAERKSKQQEQEAVVEALVDKIEAAKAHVKVAVDENCAVYLRLSIQTAAEESTLPKNKVASLFRNYNKAKQKALETYPDIVKQFYTADITDPFTAEKKSESKAIINWFKYCEDLFAESTPEKSASLVGPKRPTPEKTKKSLASSDAVETLDEDDTDTEDEDTVASIPEDEVESKETVISTDEEVVKKETVVSTDEEETAASTIDEEENLEETTSDADDEADTELTEDYLEEEDSVVDYDKILASLQGDKAKILQENKRLPDYVDNAEDDFQAAKIWQYENEEKCAIYQFRGNRLVRTKVVPGECPELEF